MDITDLRLLIGPNIYFPFPSIKLSIQASDLLSRDGSELLAGRNRLARLLGLPPEELPAPVSTESFPSAGKAALKAWLETTVRTLHERAGMPAPRIGAFEAHDPFEVVVAFGWTRAEAARTLAGQAFDCLAAAVSGGRWTMDEAVQRIEAAPDAAVDTAIPDDERRVPLLAVTGTNGKTTVCRLCAHILRTAGYIVGISGSDGVTVDGELLEAGDMSGPSGAHQALVDPRTQFAVAETARGGILFKGTGWQSCDVAVVTNVTADHLGLQGVYTVEELAWVKGLLVTLTGPHGTSVLNADDPLVLRMRERAAGKVALFSLDCNSDTIRQHISDGGSASCVDGQRIVWHRAGRRVTVLPLEEAPLALGGVARHNIQNALAATAALLSLDIPLAQVQAGLRTFDNSPEHNPGRLNVFQVPNGRVIVDYAHNEAGLTALLEVARFLAGGRIVVVIGTAGDRPDESYRALGHVAAEGAGAVHMKGTVHYTRGRDNESMRQLMTEGLREVKDPPPYDWSPTELEAVRTALDQMQPGDIIAVMCVEDRDDILTLLRQIGQST